MVARQTLLCSVACALWAVGSASFVCQPQQPRWQQQRRQRQQRSGAVIAAAGKKKVVVTGLGTLTSLGNDADTLFNNLCDGKCGIAPITRFDTENTAIKIGSEVTNFDVTEYWDPKDAKRYDRYSHLAMGAAKKALADAGLDKDSIDPFRFGVLIGSGIGGLQAVENSCRILFEKGPKRITPFLLPSIIGNTAGSMVAIALGAKGPNFGIVSECATGAHALGEALKSLQLGDADVMLAGGTEAPCTPLGFAGMASMHTMSKANDSPETASRPFDADRTGFVMGEGAGVLLLETEEHAKARGAKVYAELAGYASNCDAAAALSPDPEPAGGGMVDALQSAMRAAGVAPTDVQYINAHGTSDPVSDKYETDAIKSVFGDHASALKISSTKGATGHLLGAAGGVEAAICCKVLQTGCIPPTINLQTPDPDCDLDYTPNTKHEASEPLQVVVSDSLGFGGHNAALVFKRYDGA